jgi:predicted  nucleic acid-binding Zn-ribbon protein
MKKLAACLFSLVVTTLCVSAQSTVTAITLNKLTQPALKIDLPIDDDVSEDFFADNLKKSGNSTDKLFSKSSKIDEGFYAVKNIRLEGTREPVDLYIKIEQKGKKSNHESSISMLISKQGGFITPSSDKTTFNAAEKFLNAFADQATAYNLKKNIEEQEDLVKDAEKKMKKLQDQQQDMEKKVENLQKDLKENKEDQDDQVKTIDQQKQKLDQLKELYKKYS